MRGILITKKLPSGKSYYYVRLNYKDSVEKTWKTKTLATKLEVKNNKRKAEAMVKEFMEKYAYLEEEPAEFPEHIKPEIRIEQNRCAMACQGCGIAIFCFI